MEVSSETKPQKLLVRDCQRCKLENPSDARFCNRCGFTLDAREVGKVALEEEIATTILDKFAGDRKKLEKILALIRS